jgi:NOL1/NOP2/fmu family ribosome biogenesis protein
MTILCLPWWLQSIEGTSRLWLHLIEGEGNYAALRVVRVGWDLGEADRGRFEHSHPLAMGLTS